jgi:hypothetical protein
MWNDTIESNRVQCGNPLLAAGGVIFLPWRTEPPRPLTLSPKVSLCSFLHLLQLSLLFTKENNQKNRREKKRWKSIERLKVLHYQKRFEASPIDEGFTCPASLSLASPLVICFAKESERPLVIPLSLSVSPSVTRETERDQRCHLWSLSLRFTKGDEIFLVKRKEREATNQRKKMSQFCSVGIGLDMEDRSASANLKLLSFLSQVSFFF